MQTFLKVNNCRMEAMITEMKPLAFEKDEGEINNRQY